jgi:hypothetical protein
VSTPRDEIWADMTQFDTHVADSLWDGVTGVPDAPAWYDEMSNLIHTARRPAEHDELVDEPEVVEDMHRTTLGASPLHLRRRRGARTLGRVLAMKAAAATTASVVGVAAAAAATTGIVATVATVVVPVIQEHVAPTHDHGDSEEPAVEDGAAATSVTQAPATSQGRIDSQPLTCSAGAEICPESPHTAEAAAPAPAEPQAVTAVVEPVVTEPVVTEPIVTEPVVEPAPEPVVEPAPEPVVETPPVEPPPATEPTVESTPPDPAPTSEPAPADPPPASDPPPSERGDDHADVQAQAPGDVDAQGGEGPGSPHANGAERADPAAPAHSCKPAHPAKADKPDKPVDPVEPAQPVEPAHPVEPVQPTGP